MCLPGVEVMNVHQHDCLVGYTYVLLQKHIAKCYNPEIASRFVKVLIRGKTPTPTSLTCQMLLDSIGPLAKGTLEQHLYLTLTLAGGDQAGVDSDSIVKVMAGCVCVCVLSCCLVTTGKVFIGGKKLNH